MMLSYYQAAFSTLGGSQARTGHREDLNMVLYYIIKRGHGKKSKPLIDEQRP